MSASWHYRCPGVGGRMARDCGARRRAAASCARSAGEWRTRAHRHSNQAFTALGPCCGGQPLAPRTADPSAPGTTADRGAARVRIGGQIRSDRRRIRRRLSAPLRHLRMGRGSRPRGGCGRRRRRRHAGRRAVDLRAGVRELPPSRLCRMGRPVGSQKVRRPRARSKSSGLKRGRRSLRAARAKHWGGEPVLRRHPRPDRQLKPNLPLSPPCRHSLAGHGAIRLRFGRKVEVYVSVTGVSEVDLLLSMEHSMRAVTRTIVLVLIMLGLGSAPPAQANPPPPPSGAAPQGPQYSPNEIVDAGHRFFGTISRGLAQIVEKAGSQFGLPNGYVLGQEAGGAMVAGLRYGEGILYTKHAGDLRVFWQGPSLGFDFGGEGARTMMLVYNLPATDAIYQRFAGIDGSAYFVGGLGMTALTMNNIVVVPIRTGVGVRLGANVGYLKFTPTATWNPF